jgi:hypothetical protein
MAHTIRPDVHARFLVLVARADARVKSEQQAAQKRSRSLLAREQREATRVAAGREDAP